MNSECQAYSVMTRVWQRWRSSAPPTRSWTKRSRPAAWAMKSSSSVWKCSGDIGLVVVPPDLVVALGVADDELVLGGAARVLAGFGDQGAVGGQPRLAARDRFLVELGLG
jgi:hypothetical protein